MPLAPLPLQPWVDRIDAMVPSLNMVGFASDIRDVTTNEPERCPAAFVIPAEYKADGRHASTNAIHTMTANVSVLIIAEHYQGVRGDQARLELEGIQGELWPVLVGWKPASNAGAIKYLRGKLFRFIAGRLFWLDVFTVQFRISN